MDKQRQERENANTARAVRRQQELAAAVPAAGQQPGQQSVNMGKSTTTSGNKHPRHQPPLSHDSKTINLERIACAPETS
jgi:hypothetical protein